MKTQYLTWKTGNECTEKETKAIKNIIQSGGLVAFPTETVYGLGGNALDEEAAARIYAAKGRPSDNPLIVHIADTSVLEELVSEIPEKAYPLMEKFWPGPLTLIFNKSDKVPKGTTGGLDTVAIRMPEHEGALAFLRAAEVPIAAPSANTSGRPSPTLAKHVKEDLDGVIDMIIDGGQVGIGIESTILDLTDEIPTILRPGYIDEAMLLEVIGEVRMDPGFVKADVKPKAPGMKYRHYAPKAEMTIVEGKTEQMVEKINQLASQYTNDSVGILASNETKELYTKGQVICVGSRKEKTISKELYAALRTFDELGVSVIFAESFANEPHGEAIMNRLIKAAGHHLIQL